MSLLNKMITYKQKFFILVYLFVFTLNMYGCQDAAINKVENPAINKVRNTTNIVIGYGFNNYVAIIKDKKEIKQLENLLNSAEFNKYDTKIQQPFLRIVFHGEKSITSFNIYKNDVIQLKDGSYIKSKQIKFNKLYSIFNDYLFKNK